MASVIDVPNIKQPFKVIEIPLSKFSEEIIPHHQNVYEQYKATTKALIAIDDVAQLRKEVKEKKRNVKQLRDLMYELDTLRTQVEDANLDQFDTKTLSLRKIILNLISGYSALEKSINSSINREESEKENQQPFHGTTQIQIQEDLEDLKLREKQEQLAKVEGINKDVQDLHEMYQNLNEMVTTQGDTVNQIANDVEDTQQNVEVGTRTLAKAKKLKAVAYPVTGAVLGGAIGGPIGCVAGLKVGSLAAIVCAIAGYTGGRWFKKKTTDEDVSQETSIEPTKEGDAEPVVKKDM